MISPPTPAPVFDDDGWHAAALAVVSPNADERPADTAIELVVIHNISLPPGVFVGDAVIRLFTNTLACDAHPYFAQLDGLRVSSHFFIRRDGQLLQFVPCCKRAWHAGASHWQSRERCNDFSLGIELEGSDDSDFSPEQYARLRSLLADIAAYYPVRGIAGHSDIAPGRKTDPGPGFDWAQIPLTELGWHR